MPELGGWLLDLYEDAADGLTLWLLADDGRRLRLTQAFPVTFYAAGEAGELRRLWRWLSARPERPRLGREERRDLFLPQVRIAELIAEEFRRDGVMGADGKPLTGTYIKRHAMKGISSAQGRQLSTAPRRGK